MGAQAIFCSTDICARGVFQSVSVVWPACARTELKAMLVATNMWTACVMSSRSRQISSIDTVIGGDHYSQQ